MPSSLLYLVDSSIWIHFARRRLPEDVVRRVFELMDGDLVASNQVVRTEVLVGSRDAAHYARNEAEFDGFVDLPITRSTWDAAAALGFSMLRRGVSASLPDLMIAASAREHSAVVLHADKGFDRIADGAALLVESYAERIL